MFSGYGVVVTGASSGLGADISRHMATMGARVLAVARRLDRLERLAGETSWLGQIIPHGADLSEPDQVGALAAAVENSIGRVDLLVNNAAFEIQGPLEVLSDDDFTRMWAVNVAGVVRCTRALLPHLRESRGMVINLGSTVVDRPPPGRFGYTATKGAVEAMTKALAVDLGHEGIRVNLIRPGIIPSELRGSDEVTERVQFASSAILESQALSEIGNPRDVANAVAWLAGDGGRWVTGATIDIDGGYTLGLG